ncbi:MAG: fibronectin/fibrinogen-binding protein [Ruminococcaceae bacterium]|nr:fibronectin/fibrinogen-binding protein [Oscillospiraceae bacterium]
MAFDGLVIRALTLELNEKLENARLDKIYQPEADELLLSLHGPGGAYKLTLSANASIPRVALTEETKENPMVAPMFCMLLRKHLGSAHLLQVRQPALERLMAFDFETRNELGDRVQKSLVVEIMGRHSNIILVDENGRIADSIKRIDFSVSSKRQILPGLPYEMPPAQNKIDPLTCGLDGYVAALRDFPENLRIDKALLACFQGISPLVAREIAFLALGETDSLLKNLSYGQLLDVGTAMQKLLSSLKNGQAQPCCITDTKTDKLMEFAAVPITQYGDGARVETADSMGFLISRFYRERDKKEQMLRKSADLLRLVGNHIERAAKKLQRQTAEMAETEKKEEWRQCGELITAHVYQMEKGMKSLRVQNYFDEALPMIVIPLDETLSPAANAQRYFKKYNKAKTAAEELTRQMALASAELSYLESVEESLLRAESSAQLSQIADELSEQGYLKRPRGDKRKKETKASPTELKTKDGFVLLLGKNNRQNDYLTCRLAQNKDLWFHTKNIPGSHVVLKFEQDRPFTDEAILEAAGLAAFYSKAKDSAQVPVDYTEIKNVKKPAGAKPGYVIYTTNRTVYVTPATL